MFAVKRLSVHAILPYRETTGSVGYVLHSAVKKVIPGRSRALVKTDLAFVFPQGVYGRITSRPVLALKHQVDIGVDFINPDHSGNVVVLLINNGYSDFHVQMGDRIALLILERFEVMPVVEYEEDVSPRRKRG